MGNWLWSSWSSMITPTQCIRFFFETPRLHFSTGNIAIQQGKKTSATKKGDVICGPSSCRFPQGVYRLRTSVENHCRWWTQRASAPPEVQHRHFHKRTQGITTMTRKWEAMIDLTSFFGNFPCLPSKKMEKQHIHWNIQQLKQVRISGPTCTFSWASSKLPSCKSILPRAALPPMSLLKIWQSMSVISGIPDVQDHTFVAIDVNHSTPTCPSVA